MRKAPFAVALGLAYSASLTPSAFECTRIFAFR